MARDIHGRDDYLKLFIREAEKNKATLLDIGGDLTNFGDRETQRKIESSITSDIPVILTRGNHDHINLSGVSSEIPPYQVFRNNPMFDIIALSGSNRINGLFPSEYDEDKIDEFLKSAYEDIERRDRLVVSAHVPPRGILDYVPHIKKNVGSESLLKFIIRKKPFLVLCGHIHEAFGFAPYRIEGSSLVRVDIRDNYIMGQDADVIIVNSGALAEKRFASIDIRDTGKTLSVSVSLKHFTRKSLLQLALESLGRSVR